MLKAGKILRCLRSYSVAALSSRSISSFCSFSRSLSPMVSTPSRMSKQFRASSASFDENQGPLSSPPQPSALPYEAGYIRQIKFCQWCGGLTKHDIPDGDERMRAICTVCGKIAYQNPKMVVGCLIAHDDEVLLCKRKIEPSNGLWTLPAGYMEIGESAAQGAIRETSEEANAEVEVISPFSQLDMPLIGQTYMMFLAKLKQLSFSPGPETAECQLFPLEDIPFNSLAFSSMVITLKLYIKDLEAGETKFHYGVINKSPGTAPSDIHAYTLDRYMRS